MSALIALAERCEKATGPDREIEARIELVFAQERGLFKASVARNPWRVIHADENGHIARIMPRPFTESLDAAMQLVPDNCGHVIWAPIGKRPSAAIQFGDEQWSDYLSGSTDALALTAAALRASADREQGR